MTGVKKCHLLRIDCENVAPCLDNEVCKSHLDSCNKPFLLIFTIYDLKLPKFSNINLGFKGLSSILYALF